mmetsp:Transcript_6726/g.16316  ORF Transcript_6726/g.16316 Transcript_6726/m.16316 type:complete len:126 (+) Transcript_6726:52-429(+)
MVCEGQSVRQNRSMLEDDESPTENDAKGGGSSLEVVEDSEDELGLSGEKILKGKRGALGSSGASNDTSRVKATKAGGRRKSMKTEKFAEGKKEEADLNSKGVLKRGGAVKGKGEVDGGAAMMNNR